MKKIISLIIALIIILILFGLFYFFFVFEKEMGNPDIEGFIHNISEERILVVEERDDEDYSGEAIWFTITEKTSIKGEDGEDLGFLDLNVGDMVSVWGVGVILESYPAQTKALLVQVVGVEECYVGGCSGELCTRNPGIVSTCELLPGMECLGEMNCGLVDEACQWIISEEAAQCFVDILREQGESVKDTRIGYLFERAEDILR